MNGKTLVFSLELSIYTTTLGLGNSILIGPQKLLSLNSKKLLLINPPRHRIITITKYLPQLNSTLVKITIQTKVLKNNISNKITNLPLLAK